MQEKNNKASFIIPTLNEESSIQSTIKAGFSCDLIEEVIVVDGESEDMTYKLAEQAGARVITQAKTGKGDAIRTGLKQANNPISVFMDADILNIKPGMIRKLVETILKGADFAISDFDREGGRVTELVAKPMFEKFFPELKVNQPLTGEFAIKTELLRKTPIRDGWGAQVDIIIPNWIDENIDSRESYIGFKDHDRKPLLELTEMAEGVSTAILEQAYRFGRIQKIDTEMTPLYRADGENVSKTKKRDLKEYQDERL